MYIYIYTYIDNQNMEYPYDKTIYKKWNEKDKQHIEIVLHKYNSRLINYHNAMEQIKHNLTTTKENGKWLNRDQTKEDLKKEYSDEEIETLKQKKRYITKLH